MGWHCFNLRLMQTAVFSVAIGALILSGGCGKSRSGGDSETPSVARLDVGELPGLGDPLPPLDEGRLEISPPRDWVVSPRSSRYIVRFQAAEGSPYPTVIVTAQDCQQFRNIDAANVGAFAKFVASELASAGVKTTVKTGQIGQLVGVIYTRRARVKDALGGIVDRMFFDTVVAGRRYQFELRSPPENVGLAEPYFLAIVRGTKISGVGELEETLVAEETGSKSDSKNAPSPASGTAEKPKKEAVAAQKGEKTCRTGENGRAKAGNTSYPGKVHPTPDRGPTAQTGLPGKVRAISARGQRKEKG
ncbi:MAG: hypothetical protein KatS3mg112_0679 [Thermogutta sp.]|nr:MAG: hypothetical protein KatS3mg112_0679 [Thermogutta sp.]